MAATIATTPDDEEPVDVLIGDATQTTGPCEWMPRGDLTPTRGDPCYVQRALDGQTIVVWWGPA